MLTEEQAEKIKSQLLSQIEENFPEEKKETAKEQILSMNNEELQEFLKKNNISEGEKCIFCSIISGEINAYKIDEDDSAVAVLEINPISEGHSLIIPREHLNFKEKIPKQLKSFAEKISKKIKEKFKPKEVKILQSELFGHSILNLLPVYKNETANSKRQKVSEEQIEEVMKKFSEENPKRKKIEKVSGKTILPKRIP